MKSIKQKLIMFTGAMMLAVSLGQGVLAYYNSSKALIDNVEKTFPKIAEESANFVEARINDTIHTLETLAANASIRDKNKTIEEKIEILKAEVSRAGYQKMGIINPDGGVVYTDGNINNLKEREYFTRALAGTANVSDPLISKVNNTVVVVYAVPIRSDNSVSGVLVATVDGNFLSDITNKITFGSTGNAFMISKSGTTIAHNNKELVLNQDNDFENVKKDPLLEQLVEIEKKMVAGEKGAGKYKYNKVEKYVGYAPVKGTGWSLAVAMERDELLSELSSLGVSTTIFAGILLLAGIVLSYIISSKIAKGIQDTAKHVDQLSNGDFTPEVAEINLKSKDEIGQISRSVRSMQDSIRGMIGTIIESSNKIDSQSTNLAAVAEEMAASSQNVAAAINEVSKGTNSQSTELIGVTGVLDRFGSELDKIVEDIKNIDRNSRKIDSMAQGSGRDMEVLSKSVENITKTFKEFIERISVLGQNVGRINDITMVINGIASQTNLLALNAAIEAARVGEAGRGFAVVADEVRKLAEQSKHSAEEINKLISNISNDTEGMIRTTEVMRGEFDNQVKVINNAVGSFTNIITSVGEIIPQIEGVSLSADRINGEKNSIIEKIEESSAIAEEVSASSEEIAASSEQMSASTQEVASSAQLLTKMTNDMMEQVRNFKI